MLGLTVSAFAANGEGKAAFKEHLQNHYKFYGFIRNYFTFDTHDSKAGAGDLFYWTPNDIRLGEDGKDLGETPQFRFLALTSRVGVDVSGYKIAGLEFGAKVEADFYAGLTNSAGTAQLRLRQAFLTMKKEGLGKNQNMTSVLKVGQAWHPMAADMPDIYSLETGAPFGPFSRTPLAQEDFNFGNGFTLTGALIWQMQYTSNGPAGSVGDYMKYGLVPELYVGLSYVNKGFLARLGYDFLTIKPRNIVNDVKAKERMNASMLFAYMQYKKDLFTAKAKTVYGQAGEHFGIMSGYAEYDDLTTGTLKYKPLTSSSTWMSFSYGKKFMGSIMLGYIQNFGAPKCEQGYNTVYFNKNGFSTINRMVRIEPEFTYNIGKFTVGLEYMLTGADFGTVDSKIALATTDLHWVLNHRLQAMVKFTF